MSPFAEEYERKSFSDTQNRTSVDYVKFDENYRTVLRILEPKSKVLWRHWINSVKLSVNCPNVNSQTDACPIEKAGKQYGKDTKERKDSYARRKYIVNVLDRTPHTTCPKCNTLTPGKACISCGTDLRNEDFEPLNKVKILESGPQLFVNNINPMEHLQKDDLGLEITEYDITFTTSGEGRERKIMCIPRPAEKLDPKWLIDKETKEPQKLFDLELLAEPTPIEEIEALLGGATRDELNELRAARGAANTETSPLRQKMPF